MDPESKPRAGDGGAPRVLGVDVGTRRIGVALSDELGITAQPLLSLDIEGSSDSAVAALAELCAERRVTTAVVGLPLALSGEDRGSGVQRARRFGRLLGAAAGIEVVYRDERFTTIEAQRVLVEAGVRRQKRRQVVDKLAASLILQGYLDAESEEK